MSNSPVMLKYYDREERAIMAAGELFPTAKNNLDGVILRHVAQVAFTDIFKAYKEAGRGIHSSGVIIGRDLLIGSIEIPLNTMWSGCVQFGYEVDHEGIDEVVAARAKLEPVFGSPAGNRIDDELRAHKLTIYHDFMRTPFERITAQDIWTPHNTETNPLELAEFVARLHEPFIKSGK